MSIRLSFLLSALIAITTVGCSSSGEETGTGFNSTVAVGAVTSLSPNTVQVNGTTFDTGGADIKVDDNPSPSDLQEGMVVVVSGSTDDNGNATASTIVAKSVIQGEIDSVDGSSFVIMGFTVNTTETTRIANDVNIQAGNFVRVSGFLGTGQSINATRIDSSNNQAGVKLTGLVENLDATQFNIGSQVVDYSNISATELATHFPNGLADNLIVEVRGALSGNILVANKLELHGAEINDDVDHAHIRGHILSINNNGFTLTNGLVVVVDAGTEYINGVQDDLAVGMEVEVEGPVASGNLNADKVKFKDNIKLQSVLLADNNGILSLDLLGLDVDTSTVDPNKNETVNVGELVQVRGYRGANGQVKAIEIRQIDITPPSDYRVILEGPVSAINRPEVDILGVNVSGVTQFRDANNMAISAEQFFSSIQIGSFVKAQGDVLGEAVDWNSLESE